jgi:peptidyl-dipeptidase A
LGLPQFVSQILLVLLSFSLISCERKAAFKSTTDFLEHANQSMRETSHQASLASWVHSNFITEDTTKMASHANAIYSSTNAELAIQSAQYKGQTPEQQRMLTTLTRDLVLPPPSDRAQSRQLALLKSDLEGMYGRGKFCAQNSDCLSLNQLEDIMSSSRDPDELLKVWQGWHQIAVPMKDKFTQAVQMGNQGAKELGFENMSDLWRSSYDLSPHDFEQEMDRLWSDIKPFYEQLHCFVRAQLNKSYGSEVVSTTGPIPAHLLGNMWAQSWDNLRNILMPSGRSGVPITQLLKEAQYNPRQMVKTGENFFTSLGMPALPASFYQRSLFTKPRDRDVVCHPSAWHMDMDSDVRIKMCTEINEEHFRTIHHELGHIYYYLAYKNQPPLFQHSANDGFHEALGDTIELSITPEYLKQIQLIGTKQSFSDDEIGGLLKMALTKVAFLPFGLMVDKWRWQVFDGRTSPENYNQDWWQLREKYQGIKAPNIRPSDAFDPGAKYHIPAFVTYSRYFIAHILQFQLHRSLCQVAGQKGPLHRCSIFGSQEAGQKLWQMMEMGSSQPWPQALEVVTGQTNMDASALRDYFAPLEKWLAKKNEGQKCGW